MKQTLFILLFGSILTTLCPSISWAQAHKSAPDKYVSTFFHSKGTAAQAAPEPDVFPGYLPTGEEEYAEDSLLYYRRPPLRVVDIPLQFLGSIGGGLVGATGGALTGLLFMLLFDSEWDFLWPEEYASIGAVMGMVFGVPLGTWIAGNNYYSKGNYWITLGSQMIGLVTAFLLSALAQDFGFFVISSVVLPIAGGIVGYNLTRKWRMYEEEPTIEYEGDEYYDFMTESLKLPNRAPRIPAKQFRLFRIRF